MRTFIEVLRDNTVYASHAHTFVASDGSETEISYRQLWAHACQRAHALHGLGLQKGDRIGIVLVEPIDFILTFIGALTAGIVPVPMYPPVTLAKMEAYGETVRHILKASGAKAVITCEQLEVLLRDFLIQDDSVQVVLEQRLRGEVSERPEPPCSVDPDDLAFLQFTSGSTTKPKGVMVTHRNLSENAHSIMFEGLQATPADKGVTWLPLYHDMGLIGFVIAPVFAQVQVMFLPTMSFVRRPAMWLDSVSRYRGTITFAPNFAFALCDRIPERLSQNWDLSCLKAVGCGAEPIQADVLRGFIRRFAGNGLKPEALLPCYGMAEATLAVTFAGLRSEITTDRVDTEAMQRGMARPERGGKSMELVSCGRPFSGHELIVVDGDGRELPERTVGELWLRGPSVTGGYYENAEASAETFTPDGWLRTGDLAYRAQGEIYICGREKDLIILNGKNYYPQDIERAAWSADGVRTGQAIAFSRLDDTGAEECVVVAETRKSPDDIERISRDVVRCVRTHCGVTVREVVLIKKGTLPKTSSGKVRRREARARHLAGQLERVAQSVRKNQVPAARASSPAAL